MRFICLAAGKGTRFKQLGTYLQKCMYPIGGIPFLQFSMENLIESAGFDPDEDSITLVVGHFGEQVRSYFTDEFRNTRITYVDQAGAAGTGHAVLKAYEAEPFREPAAVWLADTYISADLFHEIRQSREEAVLTIARHVCERKHRERVSVSPDGLRITRAWQGTSDFVDIGLWKVPPSVIGSMLSHKTDEHRYLPVVENAIEDGLRVRALYADKWLHLGGTEPSVTENLKSLTSALINRVKDS